MPGIRLAALVRKLRRHDSPDLGGSSDADLLARFAATRDEAAFELLVWRHGAMVLAACRRVLGHSEDAEDAFQAAFLVLARNAGSVRHAVPSWLHRVAVRIAVKLARKRRPAVLLEVEPEARRVPDSAELGELRGVLDAEIDRLSEPYRRAVVLCYLEGLSNADAARLIGCPVGTIESRLSAARKKLRDRLTRRQVELPTGVLALLGVQGGLAKEVVANVVRAGVTAAERGVRASIGIVREPAAKLAQGVLVMTKIRALAGVTLGVALLGVAAGVGWANFPTGPSVILPEVVAAEESEVAPHPRPKDGTPGTAWPLARTLSLGDGQFVGVGPDGTTLITRYRDTVDTFSLVAGRLALRIRSENLIHGVAFASDGRHMLTAEGLNGVKVRDGKTGKLIEGLWPTGDLPSEQVSFSADGSKFVVIGSRPNSGFAGGPGAKIAVPKSVPPEERAKFIEKMKASRAKAVLPFRVSVWDTATRKELRSTVEELTGNNAAFGALTLAGHGRFVIKAELVSKPDDGEDQFEARRFTITDPFANKTKATVNVTEINFGMFASDSLSPDGGTLALVDSTRNTVRFVDTATGKDRFRPPAFRRPLQAVAFCQDGRLVAASTGITSAGWSDGIAAPSEVAIWELASGKEVVHLVDQERIYNHAALAFSPDGSFLVSQSSTSNGRGVYRIWGSPPAPAPEPVKPTPKKAAVPADVPERFQALFTSLAADGTEDAKRVESLFLAALGRLPSDVESRTLVSQLAKRTDKADALKDLLATLVETAEFKAHAEALGRLAK